MAGPAEARVRDLLARRSFDKGAPMTTNPMTAEEAIERLKMIIGDGPTANPTSDCWTWQKDVEAFTLAINRLSEPSGELVEAAKEVMDDYPPGANSTPALDRLRAAVLSAEGVVK